jgi:hypothetical protein
MRAPKCGRLVRQENSKRVSGSHWIADYYSGLLVVLTYVNTTNKRSCGRRRRAVASAAAYLAGCASLTDALLEPADAAELSHELGALADPVRLRLLSGVILKRR